MSNLRLIELGCRGVRREAGSPKNLIGQQVSQSRHTRLIEQDGLQGPTSRLENSVQNLGRGLQCIGAERAKIRIELDGAQPTLVSDRDGGVADEHPEPIPGRIFSTRSVFEPIDGPRSIDDEHTGHAESQSKHERHRIDRKVEQQDLSLPTSRMQPSTFSNGEHLCRRPSRAHEFRVENLDPMKPSSNQWIERSTVLLDLNQLWQDADLVGLDANFGEEVFEKWVEFVMLDEEAIVAVDRVDRVIRA